MKSISLHPRLVAVIDIFLNILMLWSLTLINFWWWLIIIFLTRQIIWLSMIRVMYYPLEAIRWRHFLSLAIFNLGIIFFLIFVERDLGQYGLSISWYLLALVYIAVVFLSFWFLPISKISLVGFLKPHLRWRFIMSVMGLAGVFTGMEAIISFQLAFRVNNWLWYIMASLIAAAVAAWWWWEYDLKYNKQFLYSLFIFFLIILELTWMIAKMPFGHLIGGLILIWLWYLVWLLLRFNLTAQGVNWTKQNKFLSINLILFILFLFLAVKWK